MKKEDLLLIEARSIQVMDISLVPGGSTGYHLKLFYNATLFCNATEHREIGIDVTS